MVFSLQAFSLMRYASAKWKGEKEYSTNKHHTRNDDVLCNPENSVNPDSKPGVRGAFILKPIAKKTRSIASLRWCLVKNIME